MSDSASPYLFPIMMTPLIISTLTGSTYRLDTWAKTVQRLEVGGSALPMRRDGDVLPLLRASRPAIGYSLQLLLEPLAPDALVTARTTSMVIAIRHETSRERLQHLWAANGLLPETISALTDIPLERLREVQHGDALSEGELDQLATLFETSTKWIRDGWE